MRLINRPFAALLGVAIITAGVLIIIEVVADRLVGRPVVVQWYRVYDWAERTSWTQGSVRTGSVLIAVLGLILLLAELRRDAPRRYPISSALNDVAFNDVAFTRDGIAASIRSAVNAVAGIAATTVEVTRRKVIVAATTAGHQPGTAQSLREPATEAARQQLDALELSCSPPLSVRVSTRPR